MATYARDWLEANPVDHTKFSAQPGNVRSHKIDISDRLKGMFKGFVTGDVASQEGVIALPFNVQSSDPAAIASKVLLYCKDVSSKAELFLRDEDGDVIRLTIGGALAVLGSEAWRTDDLLHSFNTTTPTGWTDVTTTYASKFLRVSTGSAKTTGGADTHDHGAVTGSTTLTGAQSGVPAHTHEITATGINGASGTRTATASDTAAGPNPVAANTAANAASGHTHTISSVNNIPAFVQCKLYEKD